MRIAAYTVITNGYDHLWPWPKQTVPVDFFCFTDNPSLAVHPASDKVTITAIKGSLRPTNNPICVPFSYRLFPFEIPELKDYDLLLYIDGNVQVLDQQFIERLLSLYPIDKAAMTIFQHYKRDCVYQELDLCRTMAKYASTLDIDKQAGTYRTQGMPEHFGFWVNNLIFWNRRVDQNKMTDFQEFWFRETNKYGKEGVKISYAQGQATLAYSVWKLSTPILTLPKSEYEQGFKVQRHKKQPTIINKK